MSIYAIALFLHVLGALGLFAALGIEWAVTAPLRVTTDLAQARAWINVLGAVRRLAGPSAVTILLSGIYMAMTTSNRQPWIGLGFLGLVVLAVLGAGITGRCIATIVRDLNSGSVMSGSLLDRLRDPLIAFSLRFRTALAMGIVFLMTTKPTAGLALAAMGAAVALGLAWSASALGRDRSARVEQGS